MSGFMTRPFYCSCHEVHEQATHYIVWGGERQTLLYYPIEEPIIDNITPHIVSYVKYEEQIVPIAVTCGIVGCGVRLQNENDISLGIVIQDVRNIKMPKKEFDALVNFKYTGYEIKTKYK